MIIKLVINGAEESRAIHIAADTFDEAAKRMKYDREKLMSHLAWTVKNELETLLYSARTSEREDGNYGVRVWDSGKMEFEAREPW